MVSPPSAARRLKRPSEAREATARDFEGVVSPLTGCGGKPQKLSIFCYFRALDCPFQACSIVHTRSFFMVKITADAAYRAAIRKISRLSSCF